MRLRAAYASQGAGRVLCAEQGHAGGAAPARTVSTPCPRGGTGAGPGQGGCCPPAHAGPACHSAGGGGSRGGRSVEPSGARRRRGSLVREELLPGRAPGFRLPGQGRAGRDLGASTRGRGGMPGVAGWRGCAAAHRACGRRAGAGVCSRLGARSHPDRLLRPPREPRRALPGKLFSAPQRNRLAARATWARGLGLFFSPEHHCAATWNLYPREQVAVTSGPRRWPGTRQGSGDASDPGPGSRLVRGQTQVLAFGPLSAGLFPRAAPRRLVRVGPRCAAGVQTRARPWFWAARNDGWRQGNPDL